ncbi:choline dehydrogenase, mitochondrial isoform X2 [Malaclemys terrapin pileata]|uniref:choline dehydrogenase, mitochondrial isoform X2 n=1 Tax=Malaclemys terrapin pileata TaxID=2991368 RepID=UPI0023A8316A|nr:choline dehydrogenase, mitochondrial isoform X2 [Malaclemys terrapin pileata]
MSHLIKGVKKCYGLSVSQMHKVTGFPFKTPTLKSLLAYRGQQLKTSRTFSKLSSENADSYSYIIVGAGSAGCVLGSRLTEDPLSTVLLLEAGPKDTLLDSKRLMWKIHMPAALTYNLCDEKYNWNYHTTPQKHMDNRIMYWPRGRVWGGSSSLNAMVYIRGHAEDYNRWHREGAVGWNYEFCLPYFKKAQTHELGPNLYRGGNGPLHVSRGKTNHPLHHAFLDAAQQAGYSFTDDMNGYQQEGFGWMDMTIHRGVGQNLQDHLEVYIQQKCTKPITLYKAQKPVNMAKIGLEWLWKCTGDGATAHLESGGFIRSRPDVPHPDIQFHFLPSQVIDHGRVASQLEAYQVHVGPMRSKSVGWLKLKSKDPRDHPVIEPNYLSMETDVWEFRQCVKLSREIFAQKAFEKFRGPEIQPGSHVQSDKEIDAFIRQKADSAYHPSCTCKMGQPSDTTAVVDPQTKVIGVENLRVVDASIMPSVVSGNLNAPTIMIAEKAADMIKGFPSLSEKNVPVYKPQTLETQR